MKRFLAIAFAVILGLGAVSCNKHLEPTELTKDDFKTKILIEGTVSISGSGAIGGATVEVTYNSHKYVATTNNSGNYSLWMPTTSSSGSNVYIGPLKASYIRPDNNSKYSGSITSVSCTVNTIKKVDITITKE